MRLTQEQGPDVALNRSATGEPSDICGEPFSATGPTAYAGDAPLCDRCVFQHDAQLAMVLAAVSVLRVYGANEPSVADSEAALDLLSFARLYDAFAASHGPRREPERPEDGTRGWMTAACRALAPVFLGLGLSLEFCTPAVLVRGRWRMAPPAANADRNAFLRYYT